MRNLARCNLAGLRLILQFLEYRILRRRRLRAHGREKGPVKKPSLFEMSTICQKILSLDDHDLDIYIFTLCQNGFVT